MSDLTVLSDFSQKVKEKVKRDFAHMIPDEAWDKLVEESVQSFIKHDLAGLVKAELAVEIKKRLNDYFNTPEWQSQWDGSGRQRAGEAVNRLICENMTLILQAAVGGAMQEVMSQLRYQLGR